MADQTVIELQSRQKPATRKPKASEHVARALADLAARKSRRHASKARRHAPAAGLTIGELNAISTRLVDHADKITPLIGCQDVADDLRLAARLADKMASFQFRVGEIAEQLLAHPEWDRAAFARDLRSALDDVLSDGEGR
jgi:hypothetical protein